MCRHPYSKSTVSDYGLLKQTVFTILFEDESLMSRGLVMLGGLACSAARLGPEGVFPSRALLDLSSLRVGIAAMGEG